MGDDLDKRPRIVHETKYIIQNVENLNSGLNAGNFAQTAGGASTSTAYSNHIYQDTGGPPTISLLSILWAFLFPTIPVQGNDGQHVPPADLEAGPGPSRAEDNTPHTDFEMLPIDDPSELGPSLHEIYVRTLLTEGHGLPCWEPTPLDDQSQPRGVVPGDVGIYTVESGFRRLFNLLEDADIISAITQTILPGQLVGCRRAMAEITSQKDILKQGQVFARGASTEKAYPPHPLGVMYEFCRDSNAPAGAILALTSSADKEETQDIDGMEGHIRQHAEAIYRHAVSIRPIREKESLYIVTGCIKSDSWAMAAYDQGMDGTHGTLRLAPVLETKAGEPPTYDWIKQPSSSRARVGKSSQQGVKDQTLFLQGFKLAFSPRFRSQVNPGGLEGGPSKRAGGSEDNDDQSGGPSRGSKSGEGKNRSGGATNIGQAGQSSSHAFTLSLGSSGPGFAYSYDPRDVHCIPFPRHRQTAYHPSDAINSLLLQQAGCDFAICHDDSWRFLFKAYGSQPTNSAVPQLDNSSRMVEELTNRSIGVQNGVAFLLPAERQRDGIVLNSNQIPSVSAIGVEPGSPPSVPPAQEPNQQTLSPVFKLVQARDSDHDGIGPQTTSQSALGSTSGGNLYRFGSGHRELSLPQVYVSTMGSSGHGMALWNPEPSGHIGNRPGVIPGDVGITTPEGGFNVIFNIWEDHRSIAQTRQQIQYDAPYRAPNRRILWNKQEYRVGRTITRGLVMRTSQPYLTAGGKIDWVEFSHLSPSSRGAALVLTSGAILQELSDVEGLQKYIRNHATLIYRHAVNVQLLPKDAPLCIVTACVKSEEWAVAAFDYPMGRVRDRDTLKLTRLPSGAHTEGPSYKPPYAWTGVANAQTKVGRSMGKGVTDQCLFIRGMTLHCIEDTSSVQSMPKGSHEWNPRRDDFLRSPSLRG